MPTEKTFSCYFIGKNKDGVGKILFYPTHEYGNESPKTPHLLVTSLCPYSECYFDPRDRPESDFDDMREIICCEIDFETRRWKNKTIELDCEMRSSEKANYLIELFQARDESGILRRNIVLFEAGTLVMCME